MYPTQNNNKKKKKTILAEKRKIIKQNSQFLCLMPSYLGDRDGQDDSLRSGWGW
jgi:hypothetical protein